VLNEFNLENANPSKLLMQDSDVVGSVYICCVPLLVHVCSLGMEAEPGQEAMWDAGGPGMVTEEPEN
jgi:hypothetical protein